MNKDFPKLVFPEYNFRLKNTENKTYIFDEIRKKWIICSPEEWVRQNLIKYLINELKYPISYIAIEKSFNIADRNYRFDALVYNKEFKPLLIIECKAPNIKLEQKTFDQIWIYNYEINAPFFLVTNGFGFIMGKVLPNKGIDFFDAPATFEKLENKNE